MSKGIVRKIDYEGRIVVPRELRAKFNLNPEDEVDIYCTPTQIVLEPLEGKCVICGRPAEKQYNGKGVCDQCLSNLHDQMY